MGELDRFGRYAAFVVNGVPNDPNKNVRDGTKIDCEKMEKLFRELGHDLKSPTILVNSGDDLKKIFKFLSEQDFSDHSGVHLFLTSHGEKGDYFSIVGGKMIYVKIVLFFTPQTALKQLLFQIRSQKSFSFTFSLTHAHLELSSNRNSKRTIPLLKKNPMSRFLFLDSHPKLIFNL